MINSKKGADDIKKNLELCIDILKENLNLLPFATHTKKGDDAEFIIKNEKYYAKSIDKLLTVYYSKKTDKFVGGLVKGIPQYLEKLDNQNIKGFVIEITDGLNTCGHVFTVHKNNYKYEDLQKHFYKI